MRDLRTFVSIVWVVFLFYWLLAAVGANKGSRVRGNVALRALVIGSAVVLLRVAKTGDLAVHSPVLQVIGVILLVAGLGLAVWARIYLGRNWGMPMTEKDEPELVTSGPYRLVRHPIYSGVLLAMLGTALATDLYWLVALVVISGYFLYSATVEERLMASSFPVTYASYKAKTKMLIPFVL